MLLNRLKNLALIALVLGALGAATVLAASRTPGGEDQARPEERPPAANDAQAKPGGVPGPAADKRFENAPGWSWFSEDPRPRQELGTMMSTATRDGRGVTAIFETDRDGALLVYLATRRTDAALEYRPVAFDAGRKRYDFKVDEGGGHHDVRLSRFRLNPRVLPAAKAEYLGFEYLSTDGRKVAAEGAARRLRKAGVQGLPWVEVGRTYDFTLTAMDGKPVQARDLRGKVVLIDCWATWCAPCLAKMADLKALYEKHHTDGLEVVGVCFDEDADKARQTIARLGLAWPQALVPADETVRGLWQEAAGIDSLPRLLLLDRDGVLRADFGPGELDDQVTRLMAPPAKESKP